MKRVQPWQIWLADLGEPVGHEQRGRRPVVVVSSRWQCSLPTGVIFAVPLTTRDRGLSHHVPVLSSESGLRKASYARTDDLVTISTLRFLDDEPVGELVESERNAVRTWLDRMIDFLPAT